MRILVVDDSVVFRSQIRAALDGQPGIEVVGAANNGKIALQKLAQGSVDLITLDMEMPEMGGIETIQEIKKAKFPVRIIVFSSHTARGCEAALNALVAGADDVVAKPAGTDINIENVADLIKAQLLPKVLQFLPRQGGGSAQSSPALSNPIVKPVAPQTFSKRDLETFHPSVIVIGSSTGGPPALERVLSDLSLPFRIPIIIAQHMPPIFTASLAKRLSESSGIPAAEAVDGEELLPNRIYVAPGDFHLGVYKRGDKIVLGLDQNPQRNSVRPAVDVLFETAAEVFTFRTMSFVLTGMGEDGLVGAKRIKEKGGGVMIQDKASSVVFGMPGAIHAAGIYDGIGGLSDVNQLIKKMGS